MSFINGAVQHRDWNIFPLSVPPAASAPVVFVAIGNLAAGQFKYSTDGKAWTLGGLIGINGACVSLVKNGTFFTLLNNNGSAGADARCIYSAGGVSWTAGTVVAAVTQNNTSLIPQGGLFNSAISVYCLLLGRNIYTSPDGIAYASGGILNAGARERFVINRANGFYTFGNLSAVAGNVGYNGSNNNGASFVDPVATSLAATLGAFQIGDGLLFGSSILASFVAAGRGIWSAAFATPTAWSQVYTNAGFTLGRMAQSSTAALCIVTNAAFVVRTVDGVAFAEIAVPRADAVGIAYSPSVSIFSIIFADGSSAWSDDDGSTWTAGAIVGAPGGGEQWLAIA